MKKGVHKTIEEFAIEFKYRFFFTLIFFLLFTISGCSLKQDTDKVNHDRVELGKLIKLPENSKEVAWEVVQLPENNKAFPGPTDFVSIIALVNIEKNDEENLLKNSHPITSFQGFPSQFVRNWIPEPQRNYFRKLSNGDVSKNVFDATFLAAGNRPVKQAIGLIDKGILLIYINYVSP